MISLAGIPLRALIMIPQARAVFAMKNIIHLKIKPLIWMQRLMPLIVLVFIGTTIEVGAGPGSKSEYFDIKNRNRGPKIPLYITDFRFASTEGLAPEHAVIYSGPDQKIPMRKPLFFWARLQGGLGFIDAAEKSIVSNFDIGVFPSNYLVQWRSAGDPFFLKKSVSVEDISEEAKNNKNLAVGEVFDYRIFFQISNVIEQGDIVRLQLFVKDHPDWPIICHARLNCVRLGAYSHYIEFQTE